MNIRIIQQEPQSAAILDGAEGLIGLDLADDPGIYSVLAGDSLQLDQWRPSYELRDVRGNVFLPDSAAFAGRGTEQ